MENAIKKYSNIVVVVCGGPISRENYWRTTARIKKGLEMVEGLKDACLLFTAGFSGHVKCSSNSKREALQYADYACKRLCPSSNFPIFVEDLSRDTVGNVYFSRLIIRLIAKKDANVFWVTNQFHSKRLSAIIDFICNKEQFFNSVNWCEDHAAADLLSRLNEKEQLSLDRFMDSSRASSCPDQLIFGLHDFYSIFRGGKRI